MTGRAATDETIPGAQALSVGMPELAPPDGWRWVRLTDVARLESGHTPSRRHPEYWEGGIPWIGIQDAHLHHGQEIQTTRQTVSALGIENSSARVLPAGTVCLSRTASVGYVVMMGRPMATSQDFVNWVCSEAIEPAFLMNLLIAETDSLARFGKGSTHTTIYFPEVKAFHVCLPKPEEQRRIVARVEALLARVSAARDRLARVPAILKRFRQSVLAAACSGRLTEDWRDSDCEDGYGSGWRLERLGDLVPKGGLFDGPFGSSLKTDDYTDHGVRVIRLENVGHLRFIDSKARFVSEEKYRTLSKHTVRQGDIIFASFIEDEVRACVLPALATLAIAKADCFCVRPIPDLIDPRYLVLQLANHDTHAELLEAIHGATRPRINTKQLREFSIRVCAIAEQREIVRRVEAFFELTDTIEQRAAIALSHADRLTQSILAKAFRGELVRSDPDLAHRVPNLPRRKKVI